MSEDRSSDARNTGAFLAFLTTLLVVPGLLAHGSWVFASFEGWAHGHGIRPVALLGGVSNALIAAVLAAGTVVLLLRRSLGRWMVVAGASGAVVAFLVEIARLLVRIAHLEDGDTEAFLTMGLLFLCAGLLGPALTLVCTLSGSTGEWLRQGPRGSSAGAEHRRT
ncbi:hypothetical protein [Actinopolyspora saharensis]|uniref:hypothetical protein n=1 Tax=Actinopolyspora saharensis TaxID=995062 RepID=UPI000B80498E|nr:hypothetical protein [Actinopolyspora saharensis]